MKFNEYFKQLSDKWLSFITFCSLIMSLCILIINFILLIVNHYLDQDLSLIHIYKFLIITVVSFILSLLSSISVDTNKKNKEYTACTNFFIICSLPIFCYPNYSILLVLPSIVIIIASIFNSKKMMVIFYILNILIDVLVLILNFNVIEQILISVISIFIITFMFKVSLELYNTFKTEMSYIKKMYRKQDNLEKELEIEPLTKLFNRKALYNYIEDIHKNTKKDDIMPCLIILDLDYFKRINDTYGHVNGDKALLSFTKMIKDNLSKDMKAFRFGGEEFIIVTKNLESNKVYKFVESMRKSYGKIKHEYLNNENITFSAGISEYNYKKDVMKWLEEADTSLYKAKESGRNQTILYEG